MSHLKTMAAKRNKTGFKGQALPSSTYKDEELVN